MKLTPNAKLVMIGDSITDAGRRQPVGEGHGEALGYGYVAQVDALLTACASELGIQIVNVGTSGHTVRHLAARWQRDVFELKPEWLSIMIGTNDVWRQFDSPTRPDEAVLPPEFAQTLEQLVTQTQPTLTGGLILMTPFFVEPNRSDLMRARMDEYGAIVKDIAVKHNTLFVDTQAAFDTVLAHFPPATLAGDRVHPTQPGHMVLAHAFLQALDFDW
jgi:lysophospholipase L1-like esterase